MPVLATVQGIIFIKGTLHKNIKTYNTYLVNTVIN